MTAMVTVLVTEQQKDVLLFFALLGIALLVGMALTAALGPKIQPTPAPLAEIKAGVDDTCPRCGGTGECDELDDWDRPTLYDQPCTRCGGSGRIGGWV